MYYIYIILIANICFFCRSHKFGHSILCILFPLPEVLLQIDDFTVEGALVPFQGFDGGFQLGVLFLQTFLVRLVFLMAMIRLEAGVYICIYIYIKKNHSRMFSETGNLIPSMHLLESTSKRALIRPPVVTMFYVRMNST